MLVIAMGLGSDVSPRLLPSLVEIVDLIQQSLKCKSLMGDLDYAMMNFGSWFVVGQLCPLFSLLSDHENLLGLKHSINSSEET